MKTVAKVALGVGLFAGFMTGEVAFLDGLNTASAAYHAGESPDASRPFKDLPGNNEAAIGFIVMLGTGMSGLYLGSDLVLPSSDETESHED